MTKRKSKKIKVVIKNRTKEFGSYDEKKKIIAINKKKHRGDKAELLDTIVHETTHAKHPKMKEKSVQKKATKLINNMSLTQKQKYLAKVRNAKIDKKISGYKKKLKLKGKIEPGALINKVNKDKENEMGYNKGSFINEVRALI